MSIHFIQKKNQSQKSLTAGPDFATWKHENLVKFAQESYDKLQEQEDLIAELQNDVKAALASYRELLRQK